jgi:hypothetical protein
MRQEIQPAGKGPARETPTRSLTQHRHGSNIFRDIAFISPELEVKRVLGLSSPAVSWELPHRHSDSRLNNALILHILYSSDILSGNGTPRPSSVKEQETPVHDSLIEERLQRERPCRTLFIRNIKVGATNSEVLSPRLTPLSQYETDSREFRRKFEEFGEIKTFFDLISHRGMVFCTYVCLFPCLDLLVRSFLFLSLT